MNFRKQLLRSCCAALLDVSERSWSAGFCVELANSNGNLAGAGQKLCFQLVSLVRQSHSNDSPFLCCSNQNRVQLRDPMTLSSGRRQLPDL